MPVKPVQNSGAGYTPIPDGGKLRRGPGIDHNFNYIAWNKTY